MGKKRSRRIKRIFIPNSEIPFKNRVRNFLMVTLGIVITALALHFFLIPQDLVVGGVTGISQIITHYFPFLNLGIPMFIANIILFFLSFLFFGKEFGGLTIYAAFLLNGCISVFGVLLPMSGPLVADDILINLVFGIIIQGIGMGIIFYFNASTGGTDIIAKIINKFLKIEVGKALFLADALIVLMATITFGMRLGLYAFLGILGNALIIDKIITGFSHKLKILIISPEYEKIREFILQNLGRSCTLVHASGGYTGADQRMILVILNKREYLRLKWFIQNHAEGAFMSVNLAHEVIGNGFQPL